MADEQWDFTVTEVGDDSHYGYGQTFCGTDSEGIAFKRCEGWPKPAFVRRSLDGEIIYRNY